MALFNSDIECHITGNSNDTIFIETTLCSVSGNVQTKFEELEEL